MAANLGRAFQNLGIARFYLRDHRGAEGAGRRALKLWDWLVKRIPSPENRHELARCLKYQGVVHRMQNRPDEAADAYDRALRILEGLIREQPEPTELRLELAHLLANKANLLAMEGQPLEALPLYHRSEEILEELVVQQGRRDLAVTAFYHALAISKNAVILGTFGSRGEVKQSIIDSLLQKPEHRGWALEAQGATGHPDAADLEDGKDWAQQMMAKARPS